MTEGVLNSEILLTNEELEQAMIINRFSSPMLTTVLGLVIRTYDLSHLVLLFERLSHTEDQQEFLDSCAEVGKSEGENILQLVQTPICEDWGYCRRRATDGLGDPRNLMRLLAPIIGPVLSQRYSHGQSLSRSFLIVSCVFVARSDLGRLCHCTSR